MEDFIQADLNVVIMWFRETTLILPNSYALQ